MFACNKIKQGKGDDHISDKINKCLNESKCANCEEGNMAGSNDCEQKKRVIKKSKLVAEWERVELFKS